jgi:hypothetical protein
LGGRVQLLADVLPSTETLYGPELLRPRKRRQPRMRNAIPRDGGPLMSAA